MAFPRIFFGEKIDQFLLERCNYVELTCYFQCYPDETECWKSHVRNFRVTSFYWKMRDLMLSRKIGVEIFWEAEECGKFIGWQKAVW